MKIKTKDIIFVIIVVCISVFIAYKNIHNKNFWDTNIIQILTLMLTSIISFFFVQHLTDKRRKIDCIEHIIVEIQHTISNDELIFSANKTAISIQVSIGNRLKHLKDNSFCQVQSDIDYVYNEYIELRELYSNHSQNAESLESIQADMQRHIHNISDKCDKIRLALYEI